MRLDHVVVVVASLPAARASFEAAGFHVCAGGRHDVLPTENALVCFADGSYLELLAAREPGTRAELRALRASAAWARHLQGVSAVARRFLPLLAGEDGVADWVLRAGTLPAHAAALRRLSLAAAGPVPMQRERTDGERLAWRLLLPESALLPFWIADDTPRERRVPTDRASVSHANGATGIARVDVAAASVGLAALTLGDALGVRPEAGRDGSTLAGDGFTLRIVPGEREGACAVAIAGARALPAELATLGVHAA